MSPSGAAEVFIIATGGERMTSARAIFREGQVLSEGGVRVGWIFAHYAHEFPITGAEEALKISATQRCGKILLYPHGLPSARAGV